MRSFVPMGLAATLLSSMIITDVAASEWTRTGPNGTVTRTHSEGSGVTVTRDGVNGGSTSSTVTCQSGPFSCRRNVTATNRDGQTVSGVRPGVRYARPARVTRRRLR
ncbi:MAG: hypothetical protein AAFV19_06625 [Pseudomonadota bacterium]